MRLSLNPANAPLVPADNLATTWAIIEARPNMPALLVVASATAADDTEPIARGLARVSHEAGQRTGYLYLGSARRAPGSRPGSYAELALAARESMRESFDASVEDWRESYDVIVVDIPLLASCEIGAHVARLAGSVIVGVCPFRRVTVADRELTTLIAQLSATIIGVVKTAAAGPQTTALPARSKSLASRFFPVRQP